MKELLQKLKTHKGKIVSSASCTELEIAEAKACNRFYVDEEDLDLFISQNKIGKVLKKGSKYLKKKYMNYQYQTSFLGRLRLKIMIMMPNYNTG